ncbi:Hypothetical predicted protein [Mytilus galloprovincialis]|uniref:Uncharacterized protein n=1 Tax=Mytilus galloprovincialis TaxID=29158 RepID=A0A8B6GDK2_MYTGA|nr:Hypothetical predicted protein [Mytilus galloprovincialis]
MPNKVLKKPGHTSTGNNQSQSRVQKRKRNPLPIIDPITGENIISDCICSMCASPMFSNTGCSGQCSDENTREPGHTSTGNNQSQSRAQKRKRNPLPIVDPKTGENIISDCICSMCVSPMFSNTGCSGQCSDENTRELKTIAKRRGITNYSRLGRADLTELVKKNIENAPVKEEIKIVDRRDSLKGVFGTITIEPLKQQDMVTFFASEVRIERPEEGTHIAFRNHKKLIRVPFVIYADFECFMEKVDTCQPNPSQAYTKAYQQHRPSGFCYRVKYAHGDYKDSVIYCGDDAA